MQRRQKTQRQRKYSVVWCHVVQILFYGFHSRWFTLFTNWVENWWKPSEISCPMCCKMALSKNKTMAPSFGTFLNFKIQKEISSLLLLQVLPFSLWPTPSIHLLEIFPQKNIVFEGLWQQSWLISRDMATSREEPLYINLLLGKVRVISEEKL